ncbi:AAA family ATPase, partial [Candidatus Dojkabacteria bacterium]|nr:AAA family ATPase [Candidatus Dojkabacteria bacterium]
MKIKNIKLEKYKKFKNLSLDLDPGVNVVVGDNEAGKSTLAQAIMDLLYVDPSTKAVSFVNTRKSWGTSHMPQLEMTFHALQSVFLLSKDFQKKTILLKNLDTKKQVDTYKESLDNLKKIIGVTSEQLYRKTAFINQGDVALVDSSDDLLREITDMSTGGGGQNGVQKIIKSLQNELGSLTRGLERPANNPGPIKLQQDRIQKITDYLKDKKSLWEKRQLASTTQDESGSELEKVSSKIEEIEELLSNYKIAKEAKSNLVKIVAEIKSIEEKLQKVEKLGLEIEQLKSESKKYSNFENSQIENDLKLIIGLEQSIKLAEKELKNVGAESGINQQDLEPIKTSKESKFPVQLATHLIISLAFVVLTIFSFLSQESALVPLVILALGFFINLAVFLWLKLNSKTVDVSSNKSYEDSMTKLENQLKDRITNDEGKLKVVLDKYGVKDTNEFYSLKADYISIKTKYSDLFSQREVILGGEDIEKVKKHQLELLYSKKDIETNVLTEKVQNTQLSAEKYLEKSRELDKLEIQQRNLKDKLVASKTRVSDSTVEYSEIVSLEEELENSKKYLSDLIQKQKVLQLTIATMQEAVIGVSKSANKILEKTISDKLGKITSNHYTKIQVKPDLTIQVYSNEKNDWVDPINELSRGTIDQIYFLVRLGFLKLI